MSENKEIVSNNKELPSWIEKTEEGEVAKGLENMRPTDVLVPRLVLLQAMSPQVQEGGMPVGALLNSVTQEVVLPKGESLEFTIVYHYLEWFKWADRDSTGERILDRSLDPDGALAHSAMQMEKRNDSNGKEVMVVTEYHNFLCLIPSISEDYPFVISCAKTNSKKAKKLLGLCKFRGGVPIFAGKYSVHTFLETSNVGNKYYVFEFENAGWTDEELYKQSEKMYPELAKAYRERRLMAHVDSDEPESTHPETEM